MFKNQRLKDVLKQAYLFPFKLQSDYARDNAMEVAALASAGYVSTHMGPGQYGNKWRVTGIGLEKLQKLGML